MKLIEYVSCCVFAVLAALTTSAKGSASEVIQAQVPPRKDLGGTTCHQTIFNHDFASSYGVPYVGMYSPPPNCTFTTTIFNLSVTSQGRQYDRLALLFFNSTELWRSSTAMPSESGIFWSYQKDMTVFDTKSSSNNNVYSDVYTGAYNVTLEALHYNDEYVSSTTLPDQIYPISALASAQNISSVMSLPDSNGSVSLTFPRNAKTAIVSILASGNGAEEFWYTNVPSEYVNTFPSNPGWLYGYSPFREVQLLIDGNLAGVSWPFPLLFTGGVDPGLWRPIVGIDAYDLPSFEIDVTPFLSLLCDGNPHTFTLKVVAFDSSAEDGIGATGENWYVTGTVFIWLDEGGNQTTGSKPQLTIPPPTFTYTPLLTTTTTSNTTTNSSFYFSLLAHRTLTVTSLLTTSSGSKNATWTQNLSFTNIQNMTSLAFNQSLSMLTTGSHTSSSIPNLKTTYSYPLNLYSAYIIASTDATLSSVLTLIDRSYILHGLRTLSSYLSGIVRGKESLSTRQKGENFYVWNETIVEPISGVENDEGALAQWFSYEGKSGLEKGGVDEYSRYIEEVDDVIVADEEGWEVRDVPATEPLPYVDGEPLV